MIWHTRGELEEKPRHLSHSRILKLTMMKDNFRSNSSNEQSFINMLSRYHQKVGCKTHHSQADADLLIVQTAVESVGRAKHCSRGGRHWSPYFIVLLYRNKCWRIIFSAWAKGKFNKTTCLENESSEGEAGPRRVQQHFLRPCNPWMWYYFSPSRGWKGDFSEEILWEPSPSQSS